MDAPLRMHYVDESPQSGAASGETILLLHGNPSWSYLWRNVIPPIVAAGHRCVAPDLVGFGKSDKPADRFVYTYQRHVDWLREALFDHLDLRDVTVVCHDWGGTIGLRLLAQHPERFRRVVVTNPGLDTGDEERGEGWRYLAQWLQFSLRSQPYAAGQVVENFTLSDLDPAVRAAYDAPYPDESYVRAARQFALLIPLSPEDEASVSARQTWEALAALHIPFLCAFSDRDHATEDGGATFQRTVPGAQGQPHTVIADAAHFVQEAQPAALAHGIAAFVRSTG
jgi:haloalkane dehalogenase